MNFYVYIFIGTPLKPVVLVQSGQLINLTANNLNLSLQCGNYNKDFNYQWEMKNGRFNSRAQGVNSHQLTITNLKPDDAGEYRCALSNSTGKLLSDYVPITVKGITYTYTNYYYGKNLFPLIHTISHMHIHIIIYM